MEKGGFLDSLILLHIYGERVAWDIPEPLKGGPTNNRGNRTLGPLIDPTTSAGSLIVRRQHTYAFSICIKEDACPQLLCAYGRGGTWDVGNWNYPNFSHRSHVRGHIMNMYIAQVSSSYFCFPPPPFLPHYVIYFSPKSRISEIPSIFVEVIVRCCLITHLLLGHPPPIPPPAAHSHWKMFPVLNTRKTVPWCPRHCIMLASSLRLQKSSWVPSAARQANYLAVCSFYHVPSVFT